MLNLSSKTYASNFCPKSIPQHRICQGSFSNESGLGGTRDSALSWLVALPSRCPFYVTRFIPSGHPRHLAVCLVTASQVSEPVWLWVYCGCRGQVHNCHLSSANLTTAVTGQSGQTENTVSTHTHVATQAPSGFCSDLLCSRCVRLSVTLKAPLLCLKVIQLWSLLLTTIVLRDLLLKYIYFFKICCCTLVSDKGQRVAIRMFSKGLRFVGQARGGAQSLYAKYTGYDWPTGTVSRTHGAWGNLGCSCHMWHQVMMRVCVSTATFLGIVAVYLKYVP